MWERTVLALEKDCLVGKLFTQKLTKMVQKVTAEHPLENDSTDPRRIQLEDRTLRAACKNAIAISVLTLQETQNRRVVLKRTDCDAPK